MKKQLLSLIIIGFTSTTFAGHFSCLSSQYSMRGRTSDTKVLSDLTINSMSFSDLNAEEELVEYQGFKFLKFEVVSAEDKSTQILLNPFIDSFEDHETFDGYLLQNTSEKLVSILLKCKMD